MTSAVALVLVVLALVWPAVRRGLALTRRNEPVAAVLATGLGVSVAMGVLSWLHSLVSGASAHDHHAGLAAVDHHHEMGALEHALRDGGAVAPLVIVVAALLPLLERAAVGAVARVRADGWREVGRSTPRSVARWAAVTGALATVLVVAPTVPGGIASAAPAPQCTAATAVRVYDVAATNVFIPYSRWINDSGVPQNGPDGTPHLTDGDPNGMLFVLQRDQAAVENWYRPLVGNAANGYAGDPAGGRRVRPRPLVLRANAGECIQVNLTNELDPNDIAPFLPQVDPRVSMHAFGVSYAPNTGDGSSVGYNDDTTVGIGETTSYFWRAPSTEGLYLFRDMGMPAGGNADGGGAEHGLYGGLAVQPAGSRWFDSVSGAELSSPVPALQYASVAGQSGDLYIDAAIVVPNGKRFRESIQLSQDVIPVVPAAAAPGAPPAEAPERFSFNFGSEAEYKREQFKPTWCADCVGEETSLSSWVYGDPGTVKLAAGPGPWYPVQPDFGGVDPLSAPGGVPAINVEDCGLLLTNAPGETRPVSCYTANVHRAYQGDPMKIRFGHAGVFETHVFHLHAHTWAAEPQDGGPEGSIPPRPTAAAQPRAQTVDSQTYSPWTAFTADLNYGAGARIGTVGDSIFHCHLYPHFAAGFWALLRVHDAYELGNGALPDGTRVNAWIALEDIAAPGLNLHPDVPLAKNPPSVDFPGYPRFIPGEYGWRAPQPVNGVWQRQFDLAGNVVLDAQGNPVDAPAVRMVAGRALDPALLEQPQNIVTTATDGSFTLSFGGQTTAPIALPTTELAIENALEALPNIDAVLVEGAGTALDPFAVRLVLWTSTADLTITATHTPVTPFVAPTITTGLSQSLVADAGVEAFTLSVAGATTTPIDLVDPLLPAADVQIAAALDALAGIDAVSVAGTGTAVDPWVVAFTAAPATDPTITTAVTLPVAPPALAVTATMRQTVAAQPGVQSFTLGVAGETSAPIVVANPTPAAQIATALDALTAVADLSTVVTGVGTTVDPWVITFTTAPTGNPTLSATVTAPVAPGVVVTPGVGFLPADPVTARIMFRLAQEQHTTRKFHDPNYVAGGPVDPANQPLPGAPVVDPCPAGARVVTYRASVIQLPITYNEAGWIDFQARIMVADEDVNAVLAGTKEPEPFFFRVNQGDCINFELTNRTPNHIGNDAYQRLVQTNMVGGHIHLVNFDVLSSDGSSNGWNYQQAAFTEDQAAFNANVVAGTQPCNIVAGCRVPLPAVYDPVAESADPRANWLKEGQTIKERWFADYELRTVFMHDHHFAAVMQNRGMFNALIVEPAGFDSRDPETGQWLQPINNPTRGPVCGAACVGTAHGATMDMVGPGVGDDFREFGIAVHDFIPLFIPPNAGVPLTLADIQNPANAIAPPPAPSAAPEHDQGGMAINYKNEPMKLRQFPAGVDPLLAGVGDNVDPAYTFSSWVWGDPVTPVLHAYRGDNVRYRLIQGSHEEQHNFTVHGTRWHKDPSDPASPFINTRAIGVSEAFNVDDVAVGCGLGQTGQCFDFQPGQPRVSDFLYGGAGLEDLWFGAWGIMRVFDQTTASGVGAAPRLLPLPDNNVALPAGVPLPAAGVGNLTIPPGGTTADGVLPRAQLNVSCPNGSTFKSFNVSAIDVPITYNRYGDNDPFGLAYVLTSDVAAIRAGTKELEPLVLRANEGDCIVVNLRNEVNWDLFEIHGNLGTLDGDAPMPLEPVPPLPGEPPAPVVPGQPWIAGDRVSMHPSLLRYDVRTSDGATVGYSLDQTAGPGQTMSYLWYADEIVYDDPLNPIGLTDGELGVVPLTAFGDVRGHRHHGLLAALVVGPRNATFHDQITGAQVNTGVAVDVRVPGAAEDYRDVVLFHHNGLNLRGPAGPGGAPGAPLDDPIRGDWPDLGERAISYANAPIHHRLGLPVPLVNPFATPVGLPFTRPNFGNDLANVFSSTHLVNGQPIGDPDTPIVRAYQGDPLRIHVVQSSDRARMLETEISGHSWLEQPFDAGSVRAGVEGSMATGSAFTFHLDAAGGDMQNIGDYRYGVVHGISGLSSGSWGIVRVYPKPPVGRERLLSPIAAAANPYDGGNPIQVLNQDLLPPAPAVQIDVQAPLDFGLLQNPATSLTVTATVTTQAGAILPSQVVDFTWPGGNATATTNALGIATIQVPVVLPAGTRTVTATVDPPTADVATDSVVLEFLNPNADLVAPTVTGVTPADGSVAVNPSTGVVVAFSERVHPATVGASSVRLLVGGVPVPATVQLSPNRLTVTLVPTTPLAIGTTHTVQVSTAVTDLVGRPLATTFSSSFVTWTTPGVPTGVTAVPGNDSVTVSWSAPADGGTPITGTRVRVYDGAGALLPALGGIAGPTATSFVVTGLDNGTPYRFDVAAINGAGTGPSSPLTAAVAPAAAPDAPTGVAAVVVDPQPFGPATGVVDVTWVAPDNNGSNIQSYTVTATPGPVTCTTTTTSCVFTGLTNGFPYSFTVTATNAIGTSVASTGVSATPRSVPFPPFTVTAVPGDASATVSWSATLFNGGSPITGYEVVVLDGAGSPTSIPGCLVGVTLTCTVTGLTNGVAHRFAVVARNAAGAGEPSTPSSAVTPMPTPAAPGAPTNLSTSLGNGAVTVSWSAPVSSGTSPITGYTVTATPGGASCTTGAAGTSCTVTGLTPGQSYTFSVTASNGVGAGAAATILATVATPPSAPRDVVAVQVPGTGSVSVSWTVPASDGGAPITSTLVSTLFGGSCIATAPATTCVIPGLQAGDHVILVRAVNVAGTGSVAFTGVTVTDYTPPSVPSGLTAVADNGRVTLSWSASSGDPVGYVVLVDGVPLTTGMPVAGTTHVVNGLTNGTSYSFTVAAIDAAGNVSAASAPAVATPLATLRFEETATGVLFTSGWSNAAAPQRSGGTARLTSTPGTEMNVVFEGSTVRWIASVGPNRGQAVVSIDGGTPTVVDLYAPTLAYQQVVFQRTGLSAGSHTMSITTLSSRNPSSSGRFVEVDAVEAGALVGLARAEEAATGLVYTSGWTTSPNVERSGGAARITSTSGQRLEVVFSGTAVRWIGSLGPNRGEASVSIDGGPAVTVDLYAPALSYRQVVFQVAGLTPGEHTMTITTLPTRNTSSTGNFVEVDALDVGALTPIQRFEQTAAGIVYSTGWSNSAAAERSGGSAQLTSAAGRTATVVFDGTAVRWVGSVGPNRGQATVSIDGGPPVLVDLYRPGLAYQQVLFQRAGLSNGVHTMTITTLSTNNPASTGTFVEVDAIDTTSLVVLQRVQENAASATYSAGWTTSTSADRSGGTARLSATAGSSVTFTFSGPVLRWVGSVGPNRGRASVSIDGGTPVTVDLYAPSLAYQQTLLEQAGLGNGPHTVTITVLGTRNPSSTGNFIEVDAFDVLGL